MKSCCKKAKEEEKEKLFDAAKPLIIKIIDTVQDIAEKYIADYGKLPKLSKQIKELSKIKKDLIKKHEKNKEVK